jgi:hypothetical protein
MGQQYCHQCSVILLPRILSLLYLSINTSKPLLLLLYFKSGIGTKPTATLEVSHVVTQTSLAAAAAAAANFRNGLPSLPQPWRCTA